VKLFVALLIVAGLLVPMKAEAASGLFLYWTTYYPGSARTRVAGPFDTLAACYAAEKNMWNTTGFFTCEVHNY
jgi:hypothetical protein